MDAVHVPVLLEEVAENLIWEESKTFVDATVGGAGHSMHILERYGNIRVVGMDADEETLKIAKERLHPFADRVTLIRANFGELGEALKRAGIPSFDAILFDLGLSTFQIMGKRGFSFHDDTYLDMRMDTRTALTAFDVVNRYAYKDLLRVLQEYGEEEKAHRIARTIVEERKKGPISTAKELSLVVARAKKRTGRTDPATKTFQAVRIEVNDELTNVRKGLTQAIELIEPGGRIGVISFHSLEDRIAKETFRDSKLLRVITKKPIRPGRPEALRNPSARSAKLRVAQKLS